MSTYKLYYFKNGGRAEVSRLIFAAAGQKYEDTRIEHADWPSVKSQTPLGQVPVLEVDGVKLPQSAAIARFLAKQFNLAGKDNLEQAKVDAVVDTIYDLVAAFVPASVESDQTKKEELSKKYFGEEFPKHLKNLAVLNKMYANGGPFFVGNSLTWVDLLFYDLVEFFQRFDPTCFNGHPWFKQNCEAVEKQPRIAEYLKNRTAKLY